MRQTEVVLHGHRVAYRVAGDPALPVVLLVHGITSASATWDPVIPALAEHAHVIAPDLLGHGDSDKSRGDYSLGAFANMVRDLMTLLGHERATVLGQSFGGGVALQFAYQFPERCERMVLVSSGGRSFISAPKRFIVNSTARPISFGSVTRSASPAIESPRISCQER